MMDLQGFQAIMAASQARGGDYLQLPYSRQVAPLLQQPQQQALRVNPHKERDNTWLQLAICPKVLLAILDKPGPGLTPTEGRGPSSSSPLKDSTPPALEEGAKEKLETQGCPKSADCRDSFAHPPEHVLMNALPSGHVVCCQAYVFAMKRGGPSASGPGSPAGCRRGEDRCKYYHPPANLAQAVINAGRTNKKLRTTMEARMKVFAAELLTTGHPPPVLPAPPLFLSRPGPSASYVSPMPPMYQCLPAGGWVGIAPEETAAKTSGIPTADPDPPGENVEAVTFNGSLLHRKRKPPSFQDYGSRAVGTWGGTSLPKRKLGYLQELDQSLLASASAATSIPVSSASSPLAPLDARDRSAPLGVGGVLPSSQGLLIYQNLLNQQMMMAMMMPSQFQQVLQQASPAYGNPNLMIQNLHHMTQSQQPPAPHLFLPSSVNLCHDSIY